MARVVHITGRGMAGRAGVVTTAEGVAVVDSMASGGCVVYNPGARQGATVFDFPENGDGVIDGIRTRNNQNHNLGLYH